jgi:very-short-patch-repair endonuclease
VRGRATYRDALTPGGVCIDLDGRLHERFDQRKHDFDRDLVAAATGVATVRLSHGQVFDRPCWTAEQLSRIHRGLGWRGQARSCGPACSIG